MIKPTVICDVCHKPLPERKKMHPFLGEVTVAITHKTKVWDTSSLLPHLCETCALRIDNELMQAKLRMLRTTNVSANAKRKKIIY